VVSKSDRLLCGDDVCILFATTRYFSATLYVLGLLCFLLPRCLQPISATQAPVWWREQSIMIQPNSTLLMVSTIPTQLRENLPKESFSSRTHFTKHHTSPVCNHRRRTYADALRVRIHSTQTPKSPQTSNALAKRRACSVTSIDSPTVTPS